MPPSAESIEVLNEIQIIESHDPVIDVREVCQGLLVREGIRPLVRKQVAVRLARVIEKTPNDLRLFLHRGLRTIQEQKERYDAYATKLKDQHPDWSDAIIRRETNKYYAPYDQKTPPGHSTGGAVDVYFVDISGNPVDLVPPLTDWSLGSTDCKQVSLENQSLRKILCELMESEGFSNYPKEYWHYSYGDSAWAARTHQKNALYNAVDI